MVFSGVGKTAAEVEYALESGIHTFNCESEAELELIDAKAARLGRKASFSIRVNPDVDAVTHPYISTGLSQHKFGIAIVVIVEQTAEVEAWPARGIERNLAGRDGTGDLIGRRVHEVTAVANYIKIGATGPR